MSNQPLDAQDIERIARESAKQAVRELLLAMGVDSSKPEALIELQQDFAHIRRWRTSVEAVRKQSLIISISIILSGVAGAIWMALRGY